MIQRIQTIHLLLSAVCSICALILGFFAPPVSIVKTAFEGSMEWGRIVYVGLIAVGVVLAVWSVFLFRNRICQIKVVKLSILAYLLSYAVIIAAAIVNNSDASWRSEIVLLPVISIVFNLYAWRRIRFDENLVRSADRLR